MIKSTFKEEANNSERRIKIQNRIRPLMKSSITDILKENILDRYFSKSITVHYAYGQMLLYMFDHITNVLDDCILDDTRTYKERSKKSPNIKDIANSDMFIPVPEGISKYFILKKCICHLYTQSLYSSDNTETNVVTKLKIYGIKKNVNKLYNTIHRVLYKAIDDRQSSKYLNNLRMNTYIAGHRTFRSIYKREFSSIFIDKMQKQKIINYLDNYINIKNTVLNNYGIDVSRNIMMYGEPGTGKTSLAYAIITYMSKIASERNIKVSTYMICDTNLGDVIYDIPFDTSDDTIYIFLIEDIDKLFSTVAVNSDGSRSYIAEQSVQENIHILMQLLDGALSTGNTLIIATTNNIDVMDPAILRSGRFDLKLHVDNITGKVAKEMIKYYNIEYRKFAARNKDIQSAINDGELINPAYLQSKILDFILCKDI